MKLTLGNTCTFAALSTLLHLSTAAPTEALSITGKRAVTGPVIFLSNCFATDGTESAEFD
jgi:hypothetical protein